MPDRSCDNPGVRHVGNAIDEATMCVQVLPGRNVAEYRTRDAERVFGAFSHRHLLGSGASLS
jgi:hypothetical protein